MHLNQKTKTASNTPAATLAALAAPLANGTAPKQDRLLHSSEVHTLVGSRCLSGHYARLLAKRGLIKPIYINSRTIRYSEASVLAFINGGKAS